MVEADSDPNLLNSGLNMESLTNSEERGKGSSGMNLYTEKEVAILF